jgi:hypothetical protein
LKRISAFVDEPRQWSGGDYHILLLQFGVLRLGFFQDGDVGRWRRKSGNGCTWESLGLGFLQKDDIGIGVATQDAETLAIRRPVKREDLLRIKLGDLALLPMS